jgi:endonuclease VIII
MPEGDTIFRAARTLHRALANQTVTAFESVLPKLERVEIDTPVTGRTIEKVEANGKWMLIHFSGGLILLTHMLMSGSWHLYRPNEKWKRHRFHMRILIRTQNIDAVAFNVPIAEFHTANTLRRRHAFNQLGPDVLAPEYNDAEILRRLRAHPNTEIAEALLTQSILAGIGNVFKSELCFACNVNPFRKVATLSITELTCLVGTARKYLQANVTDNSGDQIVTHTGLRRTTGRADREENLWVYKRHGESCRKCGTRIERRKQAPSARTTFWCPTCQPQEANPPRT